jgi:hypothetical protein
MALKADVKLTADFALTLVANAVQVGHVELATLSDAASYQVLDIVAVEVFVNGAAFNTVDAVGSYIAQLQGTGGTVIVAPSSDSFIYQVGTAYLHDLHYRDQVTAPTMVAGEALAVVLSAVSNNAGLANVQVNVFGNYRKLSEVDYLRLTCL